ncbi:MAG TPA: DUF4397 domain-containing protein [Streptosporangiaceae bacterium]|nr:DUF4397 domain-containing protein [Streptosporangiaceae bacterium]
MSVSGRAARLVRLTAAAALALAGVALASPAASASTATMNAGWLRLAHFSPNTPAVDVYLYSFGNSAAKIVLHHVSYGTVSGYERVPAGEYTVAMRVAGAPPSSKPVLSTTVNVMNGGAYTVAGMGPNSGLRLQVFTDQLKVPAHKALVRVIQASMDQNPVKVSVGSKVIAGQLRFTAVTPYRAVAAGTVTVHAVGATQQAADTDTLSADSIYTLVVLDDMGQLKVECLEDSAGSRVMPSGGASMGFGGTAGQPGDSLVPWAAAALAGLAAAAGGIALLSRRRFAPHAR